MIKVSKTNLEEVLLIKPDLFEDFRGQFIETYNEELYRKEGVEIKFVQDDISISKKNVLRGIHGDYITWKLVSCLYGKVYLMVVNCDKNSKDFGKWQSFILSDKNRFQVLIPPKYGNAYLVLSDKAIFSYKQSTYYNRKTQFSYKWNDPRFKIHWPIKNPILSQRDKMRKILKKIAKKFLLALPIPQIDWTVRNILKFYEKIQYEYIKNINKKQEVRSMNFRHYLPATEERIKRLRKMINKRPVAIILPGSSVRELEQKIRELKDCDICYVGLNTFWVIEEHILQKINRHFSIVMDSAAPVIRMNNIINFLERPEDNMFISSKGKKTFRGFDLGIERLEDNNIFISSKGKGTFKSFDLGKFIKEYNKKLLFYTQIFSPFVLTVRGRLFPQIPNGERPLHFPVQNSFSALLFLVLIGKPSKVVIFGGDGGRINTQELYFKEKSDLKNHLLSDHNLIVDTRIFNATILLIIEKINKIYNLKPVDIINCSERSHLAPFRKLSYNQTFAILKSSIS